MTERPSWVKVNRSLLNWGWYQDANTMRVFIHLILTANFDDREFRGVTIHRGEVVTSYEAIARALTLSVGQVRTAFKHLKATGEIAATPYANFQVVSISNYNLYQGKPQDRTQSRNSLVTGSSHHNKNIRNKEEKEIIHPTREAGDWESEYNVDEEYRGRFDNPEQWLAFVGKEAPDEL